MNISETNTAELVSVSEQNNNAKEKDIRKVFSKIFVRIIDIIGSLVGIALLIPLTILVKILNVKNNEDGPIFFSQERIGLNGKKFKMYKYRSMVVNAEEILQQYLRENGDLGKEYRKNKKLKNDPRITKAGKFLRKTSLDEFPQFINVLKGEMTLVGPRPYLEREIPDMGDTYYTIIKMKPGVTGPWQVSGRSNISFEKRLELDKDYYSKKSLKLDFKILLKTVLKTVKKDGAV